MSWKPSLFFSTLESAPWPYEVMGVISVSGGPQSMKGLENAAKKIGADGVIGIRFFSAQTAFGIDATGYGTAVKRKGGDAVEHAPPLDS